MRTSLLVFLLFFASIALHAQAKIISKTDSSITFVVDENLPAPKQKYYQYINDEYLASSFATDSLYFGSLDVLYDCIVKAYADHRPIVLSPDVIWITICQGFARYVSVHSEELRPLLVSHEGKQKLKKIIHSPLQPETYDWPAAVDAFSKLIEQNTKNDIVETITADFSTTDKNCRIASEITLMDCAKEYFDYEILYIVCGIPYITLTGTSDDWRRLLEKTKKLSQFGLGKWVTELEPILSEFVRAAEGNPDQHFWKNIVKTFRVGKLRGPSCTKRLFNRPPQSLDGWILKFYPDDSGNTVDKKKWTDNMPPSQVCVPFKYKEVTFGETVVKEIDMEFLAGIFGVKVDAKTGAFTPKIGWAVRYKEDKSKFGF